MAATKVTTLFTTVTRRAWHDIEPKLYAWLATGVSATAVISFAQNYLGITVTVPEAGLVVTLLGFAAAYIKKSTSKSELPASVSATGAVAVDPVEAAPVVVDSSAPVA